jgi:hypothetical protein
MLGYTISQTEGPMDNLAPIYTFAWLRLLRARRAKLCLRVLSENFKTKIALFLHHFCIIFRNHGSYKMQWRSRLVTFGHVWSRLVTFGHVWSSLVIFGHVRGRTRPVAEDSS